MPAPCTHLLYLHGFRSSPASFKARRLAAWMAGRRPAATWWCPQLPPSPAAALQLVLQGSAHWPAERSAVVGSSLGGFYALVLAAQRPRWRAVLLNPALHPARDLAAQVGPQTAYHAPDDPAQAFDFTPAALDELRALQPPLPLALPPGDDPARLALVAATGDEVLDWREMSAALPGARARIVPGSDHALSDFDQHLPFLLRHLGLAAPGDEPAAAPG